MGKQKTSWSKEEQTDWTQDSLCPGIREGWRGKELKSSKERSQSPPAHSVVSRLFQVWLAPGSLSSQPNNTKAESPALLENRKICTGWKIEA